MTPIETNQLFYEIYVESLLKFCIKYPNEKEIIAKKVKEIASFAWLHHTGYLSDIRLEKTIIDLYPEKEQIKKLVKNSNGNRKILHIATELYSVGGHTKILKQWLKNDESEHHLLITEQIAEINENTTDTIEKHTTNVIWLNPKESLVNRSEKLVQIINNENFDFIVLHIHPNDVIPLMAISQSNSPFVFLYNHADHVFNLGVAIADCYIDFREIGKDTSLKLRGARNAEVIPFPIKQTSCTTDTKSIARKKLKIKEKEIVLISMASTYKYKPLNGLCFFSTFNKLLKEHDDVTMFLIGPTYNDVRIRLDEEISEKLVCCGIVDNPEQYLMASDMFIEPFPLGTGLGSLEACAFNNLLVPSFYTANIYGRGVASIMPKVNSMMITTTYEDYINAIKRCLDDKKLLEKNKRVFSQFVDNLNELEFQKKIRKTFDKYQEKKHQTNLKIKPIFNNNQNHQNWANLTKYIKSDITIVNIIYENYISLNNFYRLFRIIDSYVFKLKAVVFYIYRVVSRYK